MTSIHYLLILDITVYDLIHGRPINLVFSLAGIFFSQLFLPQFIFQFQEIAAVSDIGFGMKLLVSSTFCLNSFI